MTEASRDPEVFLTQVNDAIEDVNQAIGEFVERSANLINSHLAEAGGILGTLLAGPIGGLVGGYLGHELEEQFEEGVDRINETWEVVSETIRQSIGGMLGDPLRMSSIASRYRECVDELGQRADQRSRGLRQIRIEVELELQPDERRALQERPEVGLAQLDRLRALRGHLLDRPLDDGPNRPLGAGVTQ